MMTLVKSRSISWKAWLHFRRRLQLQVCIVDLANKSANTTAAYDLLLSEQLADCGECDLSALTHDITRQKEAQWHLAFAILSMQLRTPSPAAACRPGTSSCHRLQHNNLEGGLCCRSSLIPVVSTQAQTWTAPCYQAMCTRQSLPLRKAQAAGPTLTQMLGVINGCAGGV